MKCISWNVNGMRAIVGKGFEKQFFELDADIFSVQEIKLQQGQLELDLPGYHQYWHYADRKGYSGVATFTKQEPLAVIPNLGIPELDTEGRVLTLEFEDFYHMTVYTPNAQPELARIDHRMAFDAALQEYLVGLSKKKSVIVCGDLNVAHQEIDLKNPKPNRGKAGFSDEERDDFSKLLDAGFIDTFRYLYPEKEHAYSWWSYRFNARANNAGWRIDYFLTSHDLKDRIADAFICADVMGSDHCPVGLVLAMDPLG